MDSYMDTYVIIAAFTVCLLYGFKSFMYIVTTGYNLCVAVQAIIVLVLYRDVIMDPMNRVNAILLVCHAAISITYAIRLASFIIIRSTRASYNESEKPHSYPLPRLSVLVPMIVMCGCIYFFETSPLLAHARSIKMHNPINIPIRVLGLAIMFTGFLIESIADAQKSAFKKENPKLFCSTGIYRMVRMPNYFGEMLVWSGSLVAGFASKMEVPIMVSSILGVASSVFIMFSAAARLDKKQLDNYGNNPDYLEYRKKTPVLIPFIPLYSLTSEKPKDE